MGDVLRSVPRPLGPLLIEEVCPGSRAMLRSSSRSGRGRRQLGSASFRAPQYEAHRWISKESEVSGDVFRPQPPLLSSPSPSESQQPPPPTTT
eukprot:458282-Alexandrium_andersonii.AAC.1